VTINGDFVEADTELAFECEISVKIPKGTGNDALNNVKVVCQEMPIAKTDGKEKDCPAFFEFNRGVYR